MSAAEYISVLVAIVIGLALADVLISLHRLIRAGRRVRWDWAVALSTILVLMVLVMMWWSFYSPLQAGPLTIGEFLPSFVTLVLIFLLASAVLPDEVPAEGMDLRTYYDSNGPYLWSLFAATLAWLLGVEFVSAALRGGDLRAAAQGSLMEFFILSVFVSLIFVRRRWWHAVAFCIFATGPIGWLARGLG